MEVDRTLRERLQTAAELTMVRALERAGNRLKGRAGVLRDTLRHVSPVEAAAVVGPRLIADAGLDTDQLLAGSWDDLVVRYRSWATEAVDESLNIAAGLVGEWRTGVPEAMKATLAAHLDDSARYLQDALQGMAVQQMFDPKAVLFRTGPDLIPTGFVRHVVGIAGGQTDISSSGYAFVALKSNGGPVGGIATGPVVLGGLQEHGVTVEAYRWVYGPARRMQPFQPHLHLDGKVFQTFDSPVLANPHSFPPFAFYIPGDHAHCRCDFEPIMLTREQAKALGLNAGPDPQAAPDPVATAPAKARAPLSALGRQVKGVAKHSDAVKAASKGGVRTHEFAFDGPDVERLAVGTRRVKVADWDASGAADDGIRWGGDKLAGAPATEYRMKLTEGGSKRWRERLTAADPDWRSQEQRFLNDAVTKGDHLSSDDFDRYGRDRAVAWERNGWKGTRGARFTESLPGELGQDATVSLNRAQRDFGEVSGGSTFTKDLEVDGRRVRVEFTDGATKRGPFALRNTVKVYVEGAAPDDALFAQVMRELDLVGDVRYPAPADVRKFAEDSLLTRLGTKRPYLMTAKERAAELRRIAAEYGVTTADLELKVGTNGLVSAELSDVAAQALVDRTNATWFFHQLSSYDTDGLATILSSGEDGLAATTTRFHDGVGGFGMSSSTDVTTGGGDFVFTRQQHFGDWDTSRVRSGQVVIRNDVLKRLDWYSYDSDKFGVVSDALEQDYGAGYGTRDFVRDLGSSHGSQETMFRGRISWDDVEAIGVDGQWEKEQLVAKLKAKGVTKLGKRKVEDVVTYSGERVGKVSPSIRPRGLYPDGGTPNVAAVNPTATVSIPPNPTGKIKPGAAWEQLNMDGNWGTGANGQALYQHLMADVANDGLNLGLDVADNYLGSIGVTKLKLQAMKLANPKAFAKMADLLATLYQPEALLATKGPTAVHMGSKVLDLVKIAQAELKATVSELDKLTGGKWGAIPDKPWFELDMDWTAISQASVNATKAPDLSALVLKSHLDGLPSELSALKQAGLTSQQNLANVKLLANEVLETADWEPITTGNTWIDAMFQDAGFITDDLAQMQHLESTGKAWIPESIADTIASAVKELAGANPDPVAMKGWADQLSWLKGKMDEHMNPF